MSTAIARTERRSLGRNVPAAVIRLAQVNKWFGAYQVLHDIDLTIADGERVVLWGPSGSGKTTLLRCLGGLETAQSGIIEIAGVRKPVGPLAHGAPTFGIAMVFQQSALFLNLRVIDNLTIGLRRVRKIALREAEAIAMEKLGQLGLAELARRFPRQLSGGQQQRVEIARALCMNPSVLLFDEPTAALDPELKSEVGRMIRQLGSEGRTIVVATHEPALVHELEPRVVRMADGRIVAETQSNELANAIT